VADSTGSLDCGAMDITYECNCMDTATFCSLNSTGSGCAISGDPGYHAPCDTFDPTLCP
jgi:hypothetical protein